MVVAIQAHLLDVDNEQDKNVAMLLRLKKFNNNSDDTREKIYLRYPRKISNHHNNFQFKEGK